MKVLCLYNIPSPYRIDFCNELSKYVSLDVVFEREKASDRNDLWQSTGNESYNTFYLKGINVAAEQALSFGVIKFLKKSKYDLIIIGGYSTPTSMLSILYLKLKKMDYVLNADGAFIKHDSKIKKLVKSFFIKNAKAWLSTSEETSKYFKYYGAKEKSIYKYPFSSLKTADIIRKPLTKIEKNNIRHELDLTEEKIVLSVGQFIDRKGFDILLKSWKGIEDNCGLYIIGGKPTEQYLSLIDDLELKNVHFVDFVDNSTMKKYYMASDLFVLTTREDIWGLVIGEAMAFGLSIISTNKCNSALELIENDNGVVVGVEDVKATNTALKTILYDDDMLRSMGESSLDKIRSYTIENMAKVHFEIFEKLI